MVLCQSFSFLGDIILVRVFQTCLSLDLNILQQKITVFRTFRKSKACDMFPWTGLGGHGKETGQSSVPSLQSVYRPIPGRTPSAEQHGLHVGSQLAYSTGPLLVGPSSGQYLAASTPNLSHQSNSPGIFVSGPARGNLAHSIPASQIPQQYRPAPSPAPQPQWQAPPRTLQLLYQQSEGHTEHLRSPETQPVGGSGSEARSSQVFDYNHGQTNRYDEQESLKEQIRVNILQQISPLHPDVRPGTSTPTGRGQDDTNRCREYNSELNHPAGNFDPQAGGCPVSGRYSPFQNTPGFSNNQNSGFIRDQRDTPGAVVENRSGVQHRTSGSVHPEEREAAYTPSPQPYQWSKNYSSPLGSAPGQADYSQTLYDPYEDQQTTDDDSSGYLYSQKAIDARNRSKRPSTSVEDVGGKKKRVSNENVNNRNYPAQKNTTPSSNRSASGKRSPHGRTPYRDSYHDNGANFVPSHQLPLPSRRGITRKDPCEPISKAIIKYFLENQQTDAVYSRKMQLRNALSAIIQSVFPYSGLYIVGSSMSGFGTKRSDMDMCLMISQENAVEKKEAIDLLFALQKSLRKCSFVKNLEVIRARVPILRFRDKISDVEVDLNVNNLVGIRNTHLLKHYALMDWRVRPLGLFIKYWARSQNINDARNMTISSYSFALMLIHYLQCGCTPPVLPSLQEQFPMEFGSTSNVCTLRPVTLTHQSPNNLSVGELFLGFLEYFTATFDYRRDAISVRQGKILPIHVAQRQTALEPRQWQCLCIEEPFELSNTARSVYDAKTFKRIQKVFRVSFTKLNRTQDTRTIISTEI